MNRLAFPSRAATERGGRIARDRFHQRERKDRDPSGFDLYDQRLRSLQLGAGLCLYRRGDIAYVR
jgi:hypothetical protein